MVAHIQFKEEENDQIIKLLGHFGKWQLLIILPIFLMRIMVAWEIFVSFEISFRLG
jgi:hypothetical protein